MQPQAQIIGAGVTGQELLQQLLQVGPGFVCREIHLGLYRWGTTKEIYLHLLRFDAQCPQTALLLLDCGIHCSVDFQQAAQMVRPLQRLQNLMGELGGNARFRLDVAAQVH